MQRYEIFWDSSFTTYVTYWLICTYYIAGAGPDGQGQSWNGTPGPSTGRGEAPEEPGPPSGPSQKYHSQCNEITIHQTPQSKFSEVTNMFFEFLSNIYHVSQAQKKTLSYVVYHVENIWAPSGVLYCASQSILRADYSKNNHSGELAESMPMTVRNIYLATERILS